MSGIYFGEIFRKMFWVWFFFVLVAVAEGQQQKMGLSQFTANIMNSYFLVERRTYCSMPPVREAAYDCFAVKGANPCVLPPNLLDFYMNHEEDRKNFTKYIVTLCKDESYDKDFQEFTKCMNGNKDAWSECQVQEQQIAVNFTLKLMKNESVDMVCFPEKITVHDCYKAAADKICPASSNTIFNTLQLGTPVKLCSAMSSAGAKFTFTNIMFSSISVLVSSFILLSVKI